MKLSYKKDLWAFVAICFLGLQSVAQDKAFDESVLSDNGKQSYRTLLKIKLFAIGGIGYGGTTSEGEKAFDKLSDENEAVFAFKSLARTATLEGGLYGLLGLKISDCNCFNKEYDNFRQSRLSSADKETFTAESGCIIMRAETMEDKKSVIEYTVDKAFENFKSKKIREREYRRSLLKPGY